MEKTFRHEIIKIRQPGFPVQYALHHGEDVTDHWHEEFELMYAARKSIRGVFINGQNFCLDQGSFLIINAGDIHRVESYNDYDRDVMTIFFTSHFLLEEVPNINLLSFVTNPQINSAENSQLVSKYLQDFYNTVRKSNENPVHLKRLIYDILDTMVTDFSFEGLQLYNSVDLVNIDSKLKEILSYIKINFQKNLFISDIANYFNMSTSYFERYFKKNLKVAPSSYLRTLKLQFAYHQLINSDNDITYIADVSGFSNIKAFQRAFKSQFGYSPQKYRKLVQKMA